MIVYAFMYCSCIYESSFGLISLHETKRGAYKSMRKHLTNEYNERFEASIQFGKKHYRGSKWLEHQLWKVIKINVEI